MIEFLKIETGTNVNKGVQIDDSNSKLIFIQKYIVNSNANMETVTCLRVHWVHLVHSIRKVNFLTAFCLLLVLEKILVDSISYVRRYNMQ